MNTTKKIGKIYNPNIRVNGGEDTMSKPTITIPYTEPKGGYIGIEKDMWNHIRLVLEHDFIVKMEKRV